MVARDAPFWTVFLGLLGMFIAGSVDHQVLFTASMVLTLAAFAFIGFCQWTVHPWPPVLVMTAVLSLGLGLVLRFQDATVADGTVLGFHPATAALVYVVWIPGFFTLAAVFAWLARRRELEETRDPDERGEAA